METSPGFRFAGFWRRFNAYGIDATLIFIAAWLLDTFVLDNAFAQTAEDFKTLTDAANALGTGNVTPELKATAEAALISSFTGGSIIPVNEYAMITLSALYNILFVCGTWQATPGKHWLGIKVVMKDGRKLTLLESAIRHSISGISMLPLGLGYITMFFTRDKLALHDIICNTRVIYKGGDDV